MLLLRATQQIASATRQGESAAAAPNKFIKQNESILHPPKGMFFFLIFFKRDLTAHIY